MKYPNFSEEKRLWKKGYRFVAGLDEAGRGPLAGPVVAAAVCIKNPKSKKHFGHWILGFKILGIKDSKQLSPEKREEFYDIITTHPNMEWGIGIVSEKVIDKINILEATKLAMRKAVINLQRKIKEIDYLILDGNFKINLDEAASAKGYGVPKQKSIIKGDQKVFSISAASIIAKVTRDKLMLKYHKKYPQYGFNKHKGYPTVKHRKAIKENGPCLIHRKSFSWE